MTYLADKGMTAHHDLAAVDISRRNSVKGIDSDIAFIKQAFIVIKLRIARHFCLIADINTDIFGQYGLEHTDNGNIPAPIWIKRVIAHYARIFIGYTAKTDTHHKNFIVRQLVFKHYLCIDIPEIPDYVFKRLVLSVGLVDNADYLVDKVGKHHFQHMIFKPYTDIVSVIFVE